MYENRRIGFLFVLPMMIPWIVAGAALLLAARWAWLYLSRRANERELEHRIRNRRDLRNL